MRKLGLVLIAAAMLLVTACGGETQDNGDNSGGIVPETNTPVPGNNATDKTEAKGYVVEYAGVTIGIDMEAAPLIEALGEPDSYYEAASCAFEGLDKMYTYGSIEIDTYELDGKDYVSTIVFKDDMISTKEGIALFMSKEEMTAAYGENFTDELGMLVYEKDGMKLKFMLSDNSIEYIEYASTVLDAQ